MRAVRVRWPGLVPGKASPEVGIRETRESSWTMGWTMIEEMRQGHLSSSHIHCGLLAN